MAGPYRGAETSAPALPGQPEGLVDELIKQFADPLAFYRELVQNGIDAGATSLGVTLAFEPDASDAARGTLVVAVRDDGCGMGRDVLEEQLTVLFRSGKEGQEGKIGKFGVGFVSVLAVKPTLVAVRTSEGRGEQWTLHLHPDQTYELFRAEGGGNASGTTVTLHVPLEADRLSDFVDGSERALITWCRHVEIPLRFVASVAGAASPLREARVDRPFGLDALVAVDVAEDGGKTRIVAGLPRDGQPYLAFFNRGLLLHETSSDLLGAVAVKILDARLEHTLSRDNVRRDAHYERAMRLARRVVDEEIPAKAREILARAAEGASSEPKVDVVLAALARAELTLSPGELRVALVHPRDGQRTALGRTLARGGCFAALGASEITEALARAGRLVVDLGVGADPEGYRVMLGRLLEVEVPIAETAITLASPVEPSGSDGAMLDVLRRVLADALREPAAPRLVRLSGAFARALAVSGEGEPPAILTREDASRDPFRRLRRPPLWINAGASLVAAARRAAEREPELAGALLARAVLALHGSLDAARDDAWIHAALAELDA